MDYEVMMNGNVKIGMYAPDFEALSTMGNICLNDYKGKWIVLFLILVISPRLYY